MMSEEVCKDCNKTNVPSIGHYCLNNQWIPGVGESSRAAESVAECLDSFKHEPDLGSYYYDDDTITDASDTLAADPLFSSEAVSENSHQVCLTQDSSSKGNSNNPMTVDSEGIGEWAIGGAKDRLFNIDNLVTNDFSMAMRHSFSDRDELSDIDGLIGGVDQLGLDEESLCRSFASNSCNISPVFPTISGTKDRTRTNDNTSPDEFEEGETCKTMQNHDSPLIHKMDEGNHENEISGIISENPAINRNMIMEPSSLDMPETETTNRSQPIGNARRHSVVNPSVGKFICSFCGKKFAKKVDFTRHVNIHKGIRPFNCNTCGKSFTQKGTLKSHFLTHTGDKPFECEVCKMKFRQKGALSLHKVTHTNSKRFECEICKKLFKDKRCLKHHITFIHNSDKLFHCEICRKKFIRMQNLKKHVETHKTL